MTPKAGHTFTAGPAKVREFSTVFEVRTEDGVRIVTTSWHENSPWYPTKDEARANVALIAEAFTVAHETGLTPRQLANDLRATKSVLATTREHVCRLEVERDESRKFQSKMLEVMKSCQRIVERDFPNGQFAADLRAAIAKAEGGSNA